jgi:hypothetical protein
VASGEPVTRGELASAGEGFTGDKSFAGDFTVPVNWKNYRSWSERGREWSAHVGEGENERQRVKGEREGTGGREC